MQNIEKIQSLIDSSEYEKAAEMFLELTDTKMSAEFTKHDFYFQGDKEKRDIYKITFQRGGRKFSLDFGQSIVNSGFYFTMGCKKVDIDRSKWTLKRHELLHHIAKINIGTGDKFLNNGKSDTIHYPKTPTAYDVLACLQKYDAGTFENFCGDFGYDTDSRTAKKTYKAVVKEFGKVCEMWTDAEIEAMQCIS